MAVGEQETAICIINFSDNFLRAENELHHHGLFVSVIGTRPLVLADEVVAEVALGFQLEVGLLKIHHTMPKYFLLLLLEEEAAKQVYAGGRLFHGMHFSL
jgi:hypothetical protein